MPLVSLPLLKTALGLDTTDASEDALLTTLEEWATAWVEKRTQVRFQPPLERMEYHLGTGTYRLVLRGHVDDPEAVVVVHERFAPGSEFELLSAVERRGDVMIREDGGTFYTGAEYRFTYDDGYLQAPGDIKRVIVDWVRAARQDALAQAEAAGIVSEKIGDYSYNLDAAALAAERTLSDTTKSTINSYRPMRI